MHILITSATFPIHLCKKWLIETDKKEKQIYKMTRVQWVNS